MLIQVCIACSNESCHACHSFSPACVMFAVSRTGRAHVCMTDTEKKGGGKQRAWEKAFFLFMFMCQGSVWECYEASVAVCALTVRVRPLACSSCVQPRLAIKAADWKHSVLRLIHRHTCAHTRVFRRCLHQLLVMEREESTFGTKGILS